MNAEVAPHLARADILLKEAEDFHRMEYFDAAINRSYYAIFHSATALLLARSIERSSHRALMAAFNQFLVHTGEVDSKYYRYFRDSFETRNDSDYLPSPESSEEESDTRLNQAKEFVKVCKELLTNAP